VDIAVRDGDNNIVKGEEYRGNGNIAVVLDVYEGCNYEECYDTIPAGKIQNGQVSLSLPTSVDSKYLRDVKPCDDEYCQSTLSVVPKNLTMARKSYLYATIPDRSDCRIRAYMIKSGKRENVQFFYFSESGKITGTEIYTYSDDDIEQTNFDVNFSKGWNLVYYGDYLTTDLSKGGTLELWLICDYFQ